VDVESAPYLLFKYWSMGVAEAYIGSQKISFAADTSYSAIVDSGAT